MERPNRKEKEVLETLDFGTPEPWGRFAGAGKGTRQDMIAKGWIELNTDPNYPRDYYQITEAGKAALDS